MAGSRGCAGTAATWRSGAAISGRSKGASSGAELKPVSLRTRLLAALLGVGLLALLATGWQADQGADVSLRRAAINQLTSIRAERKRQIEAYVAGWPDTTWVRYRSEVARYYREAFVPHLRAFEPEAGPEQARGDVPA